MKRIVCIISVLLLLVSCFSGCSDKKAVSADPYDYDESKLTNPDNPVATILMSDGGIMRIELFYDKAPNTVKNFISLVQKGFYNGLIFHRVIPGFMIQGGDPDGDGTGGPGYNIFGEFSNNGFDNDISHLRGYVSMARRGNPYNPSAAYNTAGSQFFIMVADNIGLDGDYAAFGYCFEGMEVADSIVSVQTDSNDKPLTDVVISSIQLDLRGKTYDEPDKIL